jgi:predicted nucleic acid-binding protein
MKYLLDTMVISEPARPAPSPAVVAWLDAQDPSDLALSVLSLGEIQRGIARLTDTRRKARLGHWLATQLAAQFEGRLLPVDLEVTLAWGTLSAEAEQKGRPLHVVDGLLLATAKVHDLTLVTRNLKHTTERGVRVESPWG